MKLAITPKRLILGFLQGARKNPAAPVAALTEIGRYFGFTSNHVRVTVTRLQNLGLLESDGRGRYRLRMEANPLSRHIDGWRRARPEQSWNGRWLCCTMAPRLRAADRRPGEKALTFTGFRQAAPGFWVRPDFLPGSREDLHELLAYSGLPGSSMIFSATDFEGHPEEDWKQSLWPAGEFHTPIRQMLEILERSCARLPDLPRKKALVESFRNGHDCVAIISRDPYLPDEILSSRPLEQLRGAMLEYDQVARRVWEEALASFPVQIDHPPGGYPAGEADYRRELP